MRSLLSAVAILLSFLLVAQSPQAFDFQGVARDASGNVMSSQGISLRISILAGSPAGDVAYQETHGVTTSPFGLFTIQVGNGTPTQSTFPSIGWGASSHFIQVELDASGGSDFQDMGTTQLLSVPYALHARAVDCFTVSLLGDTLHQGNGCHVIIPGISVANGGCLDLDGDGFYDRPGCGPVDCDDNDPMVNPGMPEICGDGIDNDCDGGIDNNPDVSTHLTWYLDADGDGFGTDASAVVACAFPGPGYVLAGGDCDDGDPSINPGAQELCDGIDNNCNGLVDEDFNLATDTQNCGACGNACPPGAQCQAGSCVCVVSGQPCDDGDPCTINDTWDVFCNCVGTPVQCGLGEFCVNGDCVPDTDSDGDGVRDIFECPNFPNCPDSDGDGLPDYLDIDDDGDGVRTQFELGPSYNPLTNTGARDTDGDGIPDYLDNDDDGDGVRTQFEMGGSYNPSMNTGALDADGDGSPNYLDADDDGDGVLTQFEIGQAYNPATNTGALDTDADGIPNYLDIDDDGDGVRTVFERGPSYAAANNSGAQDTDGDGIPDYLDNDDDGDGIPTPFELGGGYNAISNIGAQDTDGDGVPDYRDPDDDGDGIPTSVECPVWPNCPDNSGNGIPDYLDPTPNVCTDADGDGFFAQTGCGTPVDCDDSNPNVYPGAPELCDNTDNNCNGQIDEGACEPELCDGVDNNGNGLIDAADPNLVLVPCENQVGVCAGVLKPADKCVDGVWLTCTVEDYENGTPFYNSSDDPCDGLDNNCDGQVDEDDVCATCDDGVQNGLETDVDCGGPDCDPCNEGQGCASNSDCGPGLVCQSGVCVLDCPPSQTNCGGTCVDLQTNMLNCGDCAVSCPPGTTCVNGACICLPAGTVCDDGDPCTISVWDGNCTCVGTPVDCPPGETCIDGTCVLVCPSGQTNCGGICVNLQTDVQNCGDCGVPCPPGFTCQNGTCVCPAPGTACDDGDPCTINDVWDATCACVGTPVDCPPGEFCFNGDCIADTDTDGDGVPDAIECPDFPNCPDTDGDGTPDYLDIDDDGDGVRTQFELGPSYNPLTNTGARDTDGDGIPDYLDPDDDGDGIPTFAELGGSYNPATNTGALNVDGDSKPDYLDPDDDGDGVPTNVECPVWPNCPDTDNDGIPDQRDNDDDGDGVRTAFELGSGYFQGQGPRDTDMDGVPDYLDPDDDGDGVLSKFELGGSYNPQTNTGIRDTDGDGIPNYLDIDDDGDGVFTLFELGGSYNPSTNTGLVDSDGDSEPNYLDADDDGDGIPTQFELGPSYDAATNTGALNTDLDVENALNSTNVPDYLDDDDDGDGVRTQFELGGSYNPATNTGALNTDGDAFPNYLDADDDGDGIPTSAELGGSYNPTTNTGALDTDADGIPNYRDPDDDGDGVPTIVECPVWPSCPDSNGNGIPDYLDPSSSNCTDVDGDGFFAGSGCGTPVDCDDNDPTVYPGAPELCDGKDNDCDGQVDEDNVCDPCTGPDVCFIDGQCYASGESDPFAYCHVCEPLNSTDSWSLRPAGVVCNLGDGCTFTSFCDGTGGVCPPLIFAPAGSPCDDGNPNTTNDVCDGFGNCSGTPCTDADGDGYFAESGCGTAVDCDDNDPTVYPGAPELCDGKDNDCDGQVDEDFDLNSDPNNCGACQVVCSQLPNAQTQCFSGNCTFTCLPGFADCDGLAGNGCEVDLTSNGQHCGGCNVVCPVNTTCQDGICVQNQPTCSDGIMNGQETGVDCGGPTCPSCGPGQGCIVGSDCDQGYICQGGICVIQGVSIDWAILQFPPSITMSAGTSPDIYGQVYSEGVTDGAGHGAGITAQVGYGAVNSDPWAGGWTWSNATFNTSVGNNDEYQGAIMVALPGQYHYAYRFSGDGGATWTYADLDGSHNGYSSDQAGQLTVQ